MADSQMDEGGLPITGLDELENHLQVVVQSPDTTLNANLFDEVNLQLTGMSRMAWYCRRGRHTSLVAFI
jgi:hypothetical protein